LEDFDMIRSRRDFLWSTGAAASWMCGLARAQDDPSNHATLENAEPILDVSSLASPIVIASMELLKQGQEFLVRVRSRDGAEGIVVANSERLIETYPIFLRRVAPFFVGRDARRLESLLIELYRHESNYKLQGLAFWVCVAAAEMAILELLGQISGKSIADFFGGLRRRDIDVYRASGNRGNRPEEEVEYLRQLVAETGARALKFRVGGRMSHNVDSLPGRSEALIPLVRQAFGAEMTLYADSNSSYDVEHAIRIGRIMEEHDYAFFEEPCPFDDLWGTRDVAHALAIPVAGGEQEFSLRRFHWLVTHRGVDIVQPDLHYFGGYIRCTHVARMAEAAGIPCTLHMSGAGLGFLNVLHFASYTANPGPFQEYKGSSKIPFHCETSSLECQLGIIRVPTGPGFGIQIDPDFVKRAERVST
jgi:L-alanine-DL-glutamate epimerase-like enolase superfamily enzyme